MTRTLSARHVAGWKTKNNNSSTMGSELRRNTGPSTFQLQVSMLKSDKIWCAYLVVNCVSLRTFRTPLVVENCSAQAANSFHLPTQLALQQLLLLKKLCVKQLWNRMRSSADLTDERVKWLVTAQCSQPQPQSYDCCYQTPSYHQPTSLVGIGHLRWSQHRCLQQHNRPTIWSSLPDELRDETENTF